MVLSISTDRVVTAINPKDGLFTVEAGAVILAKRGAQEANKADIEHQHPFPFPNQILHIKDRKQDIQNDADPHGSRLHQHETERTAASHITGGAGDQYKTIQSGYYTQRQQNQIRLPHKFKQYIFQASDHSKLQVFVILQRHPPPPFDDLVYHIRISL